LLCFGFFSGKSAQEVGMNRPAISRVPSWRFFVCLIFIALFALLAPASQTDPAYAYKEPTHEEFNEAGADVVEHYDSDGKYEEIYLAAHIARLRQGATGEDRQYASYVPTNCNDGRFMRHFYQPGQPQGAGNGLIPPTSNTRCTDAVTWARSSANDPNAGAAGDLTWTGALDRYDYTAAAKEEAYLRVGHVAHLIGDMAQPDHVHLHPHPFEGYELWAEGAFSPPSPGSITIPGGITRVEDFLINMATITYQASSFQGGTLAENANTPVSPTSELARAWNVTWVDRWWPLDNLWELRNHGATGAAFADYDGDYGRGYAQNEWWETNQETGGGLYGGGGYYALGSEGQVYMTARPAFYKGAANTRTLAQIYLDTLPPQAIGYIAAMYQHFHDVANHPPYVYSVKVTQAGRCIYEQHWEDQESNNEVTGRTLEDDCDTPEEERWINAEDGEVQIEIEFAPRVGDTVEPIQNVEVRIGSTTVQGQLDEEEGKWTGSFTPPDDGSLDGEQTIEITAQDKHNHFSGRNFPGDQLDAKPDSPAKAGSATPYNWQGFDSGPDKNHKIKIDTQAPEIRIRYQTVGSQCEPRYEVRAEVKDQGSGDGRSGLLRVTASPGGTFDPASDPQTIQMGTIGVGDSLEYSVEAEDKAGNKEEKAGNQPGPSRPPGCDHSDDNYSAASPVNQVGSTVPLDDEPVRVAILSNGFSPDSSGFVNALHEPNILVEPDFSPDIVEEYPLLVIPTGGLYGLENSAYFRATLEEYANRGGTIVVFDQQQGSEYTVLPGGELDGYGWAEDNSCTLSSLYIRNYTQVVSGFSDAILDSNVDGYFTDLPDNSEVLLYRAKNGQPAMVRYEFGAGTVIATTAYDDWGRTNWQTTADAYVLNRDLLAWAVDPALLAEFDPGAAVSLSVPVTNNSSVAAESVRLSLLAPGKQIVSEETRPLSLATEASSSLTFNTTATNQLGIWRVDYALLDASGRVIQERQPGERFVVKNPHPLSAPVKEVALSVNAATEDFISGSDAEFTFTVFNNSSVTRTLTVRYGLPHHTWETGQSAIYGNFSDLSRTVTVGPNSQEQFVHVFPMRTNDRLFAYLYEGSVQRDATWFQTRKTTASATVALATGQAQYARNQTVNISATVTNLANLTVNYQLNLRVTAPDGTAVYSDTRPVSIAAGGQMGNAFSFVLPATVPNGTFRIQADLYQGSARISGSVGGFVLPNSPARFNVNLPDALPVTAGDPLQVVVTNPHGYLPVNGTLSVVATAPDGSTVSAAAQPYTLAAGGSTTLNFDLTGLPAAFGQYRFEFASEDEYNAQAWATTGSVSLAASIGFDRRTYRIRETLGVEVTVENEGDFAVSPALTLSIPDLAYSDALLPALDAGEANTLSYSLPLPDTLASGAHDVYLDAEIGTAESWSQPFYVPMARVSAAISQTAYTAGDTLIVTLTNQGGVDGPVSGAIKLIDPFGYVLAPTDIDTTVLAGQSTMVEVVIPDGAADGAYQLVLDGEIVTTGSPFALYRQVNVAGVAAGLSVQTGQPAYFSDEAIDAEAALNVTSGSLNNGNLNLRVCMPTDPLGISDPGGGGGGGGGSTFRQSYEESSATINWTEIATTGTIVAQGDDTFTLINIGFPFEFYGTTYTQAYVGSNGYVTFGSGNSSYSNTSIPNPSTPNNAIYAFWDDLYPAGGVYGNVYVQQVDATHTIIEWKIVSHCCSTGTPETFQVILDGTDHSITLQYLDVTAPGGATVGVENNDGSVATQLSYDQSNVIVDGAAFRLEAVEEEIVLPAANFKSYLYTVGDVIFFSYADDSDLALYRPDGSSVWQGTLDAGQRQLINVPTGTYLATGSQKFALLGGDPVSQGVAGYYAADQNGFGVSRELYTYTQSSFFSPREFFIVFGYEDNTQFTVADANTGVIYYTGTLNNGQHWQSNTLHNRWLHVTADKPVSAYTYYDQGSLVPAADGRWSGTLFYAYAGLVGNWANDVNIMAFEDDTQVTLQNLDTGQVYWTGTLDSGQMRSEPFGGFTGRGAAYLSVSSDKTVAVTVAPFVSFTGSYHMGFYAPDSTGSRIGTDLLAPIISGGTLQIFAYHNDTVVELYNSNTEQLVNTYTLQAGESINPAPGYGLWRLRSDKPVSAWAGWGQASAEFAPVRFGDIVIGTPFDGDCGYVLWEGDVPVTTTTTLDVNELVEPLNVTGRLILDGRLYANTGQRLAHDAYPFYLHDRDTALTLEADQPLYAPGDQITASGRVTNTTTLTAAMTLEVSGGGDTLLTQPLTLAPGEGYGYSLTLTATQTITLMATAANAETGLAIPVVGPQVTAELVAPDVAGRTPFPASLIVRNTGLVPATVVATIVGSASDSFTLPPGGVARVNGLVTISQDTTIVGTLSGDANDTVNKLVLFGEAADVAFTPEAVYPVGPVDVPYLLANLGAVDVSFDTDVTLRDGDGSVVTTLTLPADLADGENRPGSLHFAHLAAGEYSLEYDSFFAAGSEPFTVVAEEDAELAAVADSSGGPTIPVTATVTNTGLATFNGQIVLESGFFATAAPVNDLASGDSVDIVLPVDTGAAASGSHPVQLTLLNLTDEVVDEAEVSVAVAAPDLVLIDLSTNLTLPVSTTVTLTFGIRNQGGAAGNGLLGFTFSDVADEEQLAWLAAGQDGTVSFTFFVPPDLEAKTYPAEYHFNGEPGVLLLTVEGIDIDVTPSLDRSGYYEGETAVLNLHVEELADRFTPPLYALVRFNEYSEIQPFSLSPSGSADVAFNVPVSFLGDEKVFYGIYDLGSDRSIHLNTVYLPRLYPDVTILTDKQVYLPGETVVATVVTTATGQLDVVAPGFDDMVTLPGGNTSFSFVLPLNIARGSYSVDGVPQNCQCVNEGQTLRTPFDVAAAEVRVTDSRLDQAHYEPGDSIQLDLTVASDQLVAARLLTWIERPDGSLVTGPTQSVDLAASPANLLTALLTLDSGQAGMHNVIYRLVSPADSTLTYGQGAEAFDVGSAIIVAVRTDKATYPTQSEPVVANVVLFATAATAGNLNLSVDGVTVHSQPVSLASGFQEMSITLPGGYGRGEHSLRSTLTEGGLQSWRATPFRYATSGPDLIARPPSLGSASSSTAALVAIIGNRGNQTAGANSATLYAGDPASGGVAIATFAVPALSSGASHEVTIPWPLSGRAGNHLLVLVADVNAQVDETNEVNNVTSNNVVVGALSHTLSSDKPAYYRSDTALLTASLENLSSSDALTGLVLETAVYRLNGTQVGAQLFSDSRPLADLAAGQSRQEVVDWTIAPAVAEFDLPLLVQQQVMVNGAAQPLQEINAAIIPIRVTVTAEPGFPGHYATYTEAPTLSLAASDTADIFYQWDSDPRTLYSAPFESSEGNRTLTVQPERNGITVGPAESQFVSVDSLPPQTTIALDPPAPDGDNGWYVSDVEVTLTATDPGVGVYQTLASTDSLVWSAVFSPTLYTQEGQTTLYYHSVDWMINTEAVQSTSFRLDKTGPTLVHNGPYTMCAGDTITLDGAGSFDSLSGLASVNWDTDGDGLYDDGPQAAFTWPGGAGPVTVGLAGVDEAGNVTLGNTTVSLGDSATGFDVYPIALHVSSLAGVAPGSVIADIYNGSGQGNFGWLTWNGDNGVPALVTSLTPPGNSDTFVNPHNPADHELSAGDWVEGRPGVANANDIRAVLDALRTTDNFNIIVPVWDTAEASGAEANYHIVNFAIVHLTDYTLPSEDRISVRFVGYASCGGGTSSLTPEGKGIAAAVRPALLPAVAVFSLLPFSAVLLPLFRLPGQRRATRKSASRS
jgi:hypothetical protein